MKPTVTIAYFILALLFCSCTKPKENKTISLDSNWQFRKAGDTEWLPAKVPGCVHTDLLDHKKFPTPSSGNETGLNADLKMNTIFNSY